MIVCTLTENKPQNQGIRSCANTNRQSEEKLAAKSILSNTDKKLLKIFGSRIRHIREKKNLTVYDVTGDDMPVKSRQHWQSIENGNKNINITTVFKVAKSLEVHPEDLLKNLS